ncbi:G-protein coupled receptor 39 [Labeo rohita]|uniref:G-protein coupled receptor 39 n=1 Tax=Labeo rohita TaxID=84645 RepID=A0ABQ8LVF2_LABRO|nr:G-protein coupled receptor 39 [Labeo rohita]
MIPNRSISLQFMHRWQMKLSYLFKAFSIYLFSLKSLCACSVIGSFLLVWPMSRATRA